MDIWALAMIFCHLVLPHAPWKTVRVPCDALDDHFDIFSWQTVRKMRGGKLDSRIKKCRTVEKSEDVKDMKAMVASLLPHLPPGSGHIIGRMLEPRPEDRAGWSEILGDKWVSEIQCPGR